MPGLVWIRIEDVAVNPWRMWIARSQFEATPLGSADAQQAIRWASDNHQDYRWEPVATGSTNRYIVQGSPR